MGAGGLTKIPNKEVSAMPTGTSIPKKPPTSPPSSPVPPTAARNFRQRDFSNFHCTSQRDFPHANGMRNVRWKRRSDKHTGRVERENPFPPWSPSSASGNFFISEFVSNWIPIWRIAAVICARKIRESRMNRALNKSRRLFITWIIRRAKWFAALFPYACNLYLC